MRSIKLYYTDINQVLSESEYEKCIRLLTPEKVRSLKRFRMEEDRKRTLYGEVMARCLFMKLLDVKNENLVIAKNKYGKPYFVGINRLHYNISHSGSFVICGISNQKLGVDIEKIESVYRDITMSLFTKTEYEAILNLNEDEVKKLFYTYWTLKESYVKYQGKGLSIPLNSFSIEKKDGQYVVNSIEKPEKIQMYSENIESDYIIAVTYEGEKRNVELIYRDLRNLLY